MHNQSLPWKALRALRPLGAAPRGHGVAEARAGGGKPRARRGHVGAGKRGGDHGAEGVARVVSDRLPDMRQLLRAG